MFPLLPSLWIVCSLSLPPLFAPTLIWVPSASLAAVEFTHKQSVTQMRLMAGFAPPAAAPEFLLGADPCTTETTRAAPASAEPASSCDKAGPRGRTRCSLKYQQRGERHDMRLGYRVVSGHVLHKLHMRELLPDFYSQPVEATCPPTFTEKKNTKVRKLKVLFSLG